MNPDEGLFILTYPHPFLRRKAAEIAEVTDDVRELARLMVRSLTTFGGAGLAAPQVGYACRLVVMNLTGEKDSNVALVNPKIVEYSEDTVELPEACLSLPKIRGRVVRPRAIKVKATTLDGAAFGEEDAVELQGWSARVLQHEIDHLDGVLFIDHLTGVKHKMIEKKLQRLHRLARKRTK